MLCYIPLCGINTAFLDGSSPDRFQQRTIQHPPIRSNQRQILRTRCRGDVRSAGSEEKSDGKNVVKAAISVVTGLMKMPSTSFAMVCSTVPMGSIRFAAMSRANSTRVIAEMAKPS